MKRILATALTLAITCQPVAQAWANPGRAVARVQLGPTINLQVAAGAAGQSLSLPGAGLNASAGLPLPTLPSFADTGAPSVVAPSVSQAAAVQPSAVQQKAVATEAAGQSPAAAAGVQTAAPAALRDSSFGRAQTAGPASAQAVSEVSGREAQVAAKKIAGIRQAAGNLDSGKLSDASFESAQTQGSALFDNLRRAQSEAAPGVAEAPKPASGSLLRRLLRRAVGRGQSAAAQAAVEKGVAAPIVPGIASAAISPAEQSALRKPWRSFISRWTGSFSSWTKNLFANSYFGRFLPKATAEGWGRPKEVETAFSPDEYGGPKPLAYSQSRTGNRFTHWLERGSQNIQYGLKWSMTMVGLTALIGTVISQLQAFVPWQLGLGPTLLSFTGRVELMTGFGPEAIGALVENAPLTFFGFILPVSAATETLTHILLGFWVPFLVMAVIRTLMNKIGTVLAESPQPGSLSVFGRMMSWLHNNLFANRIYDYASVLSAFGFAAAHMALWGFSPFTFGVHFVAGLALAHISYRTRSLVAPFIAHLFFNLGMISVGFVLPALLAAQTATLVSAVAGLVSLAWLYFHWRSYHRDRKAAVAAARGQNLSVRGRSWIKRILFAAIAVPLFYSFMNGTSVFSLQKTFNPVRSSDAPAAVLVQDAAPRPAPGIPAGLEEALRQMLGGAPAAAPKPVLSTEDIVRQSKQGVVMVRTPGGMGSGFIVDKNGFLITNAHVVARRVTPSLFGGDPSISSDHHEIVVIRFQNGREVKAKVVGYNADKDLALVQLPPNPFGYPAVRVGDHTKLIEGERIIAMGHPRGLPFTVTEGVVSGLGSRSNGFVDYIQHDGSVNPGNSGGPLFNKHGEVVGVNSMIMTESGGFDGISYAITSGDVKTAIDQYNKVGHMSSSWMGAIFYPSNPLGSSYGLEVDAVRPGSPAHAGGLRTGDVVLAVDGHRVEPGPQGLAHIAKHMRERIPTGLLELQVERGGSVHDLKIILGAK